MYSDETNTNIEIYSFFAWRREEDSPLAKENRTKQKSDKQEDKDWRISSLQRLICLVAAAVAVAGTLVAAGLPWTYSDIRVT